MMAGKKDPEVPFFVMMSMMTPKVTKAFMDAKMSKLGLNCTHAMYIKALSSRSMTLTELSSLLTMDKASTTRSISDLREKGLITDDRESENSRGYNVSLTDEGRKISSSIDKFMKEGFDIIWEGVDDKERDMAIGVLRKVFENMSRMYEGL